LLEAAKFILTQEHEAELENWNREYNASLQKEAAKQVVKLECALLNERLSEWSKVTIFFDDFGTFVTLAILLQQIKNITNI
jgi:nucleoid DNA-binding protein